MVYAVGDKAAFIGDRNKIVEILGVHYDGHYYDIKSPVSDNIVMICETYLWHYTILSKEGTVMRQTPYLDEAVKYAETSLALYDVKISDLFGEIVWERFTLRR